MKSRQIIAGIIASAGLLWGSAHAAHEAAEAVPEAPPGIIIFELQPAEPGAAPEGAPPQSASEQEQLMLGMLLLQMLSGMQAEGGTVEVQQAPPQGDRI